jgi:uncharacterized protein (DUF1015 family)
MPRLEPFRGISYSSSERAKDLVCPPYDVISPEEQQALYDRDPHNAVRLELAANAGDPGPEQYRDVAETVSSWLHEGILDEDGSLSLYVYRQDFIGPADSVRRRVSGVIGALELEEFGNGVLPHERTMQGPKADRLALMRATQMNFSPIYAIYRGGGGLAPFYASLESRPSVVRFSDDDGILHRLWTITAQAEIDIFMEALAPGPLVIADGHHRYETALAYSREQRERGAHDAIMCFCVDADSEDLVVLPYNRALRAGLSDIERPLASFQPKKIEGSPADALAASKADHPFVAVHGDHLSLLELSDADVVAQLGHRAVAWRALDVVALHEVVLPQAFPQGIDEIVFSRDPDEVTRMVLEEGWDLGILLRPLDAAQVVDVARSGERMPQKASYFWPKALTGLVFRSLRVREGI